MNNQVSVKYVGYRLNYTSGRLSLGPPERGAAEKIVLNKERTKGWGWGWATASVEEGMVVRSDCWVAIFWYHCGLRGGVVGGSWRLLLLLLLFDANSILINISSF